MICFPLQTSSFVNIRALFAASVPEVLTGHFISSLNLLFCGYQSGYMSFRVIDLKYLMFSLSFGVCALFIPCSLLFHLSLSSD